MVGRQVLLHPCGDFFYFGIVVCFRAVVALGPAADLAFEISFGLAEIGEASGGVIHMVQAHEIINEGFAEAARFFCGKIQTVRESSAQDDAVDRLHHVERARR